MKTTETTKQALKQLKQFAQLVNLGNADALVEFNDMLSVYLPASSTSELSVNKLHELTGLNKPDALELLKKRNAEIFAKRA